MEYTFWIELLLFILLMGLSGFFSSSETAFFSLKRMHLEQMRQNRHPKIDLIERMLSQPRRLIMTILIGNELVNVAASVISAGIVIRLLGAGNKWINIFIMVPILLLVGEIIPKTLAVRNNMAFAGRESGPIEIFSRLTRPVRWLIRKVADRLITLVVGKERSRGNIITEDMVRTMAYDAVDEGVLDSQEALYIDHILAFNDKTLEDIMTPRSDTFFLASEMSLLEMMAEMRRIRHTKAPVYKENRDSIVGILHTRGLLGIDIDQVSQEPGGIEKLLLEPYFVPESKLASELFRTFRERKLSLALTVDEYGGVTGLVTMEDLLECIFGDIHSPSDGTRQVYLKKQGDGTISVNAAMPIVDFNHEIGCQLPHEKTETIGGLLLHHCGELPSTGTIVEIDALRFTVTAIEGNRISAILLERPEKITGEKNSSESIDSGSGGNR
jgi:CBS domain containing-hemolysin-like protein